MVKYAVAVYHYNTNL